MTKRQLDAINDRPNGHTKLNFRISNTLLHQLLAESKLEERSLSATTKRILVEGLAARNRKRMPKRKIPWDL